MLDEKEPCLWVSETNEQKEGSSEGRDEQASTQMKEMKEGVVSIMRGMVAIDLVKILHYKHCTGIRRDIHVVL